jgi:hypothetical protein
VDPDRRAAARQLLADDARDQRHCEQRKRKRNQRSAKLRERRSLGCRGRAGLGHQARNEVRLALQRRHLASRLSNSERREHGH